MASTRPSFKTILDRVIGDISSRTEGSAYIRRSFERVLAYVIAGVAHGLHGRLDWVLQQLLPTTADIERLLAWGEMLDIPRKDASQAVRILTFTGTNGSTIPIGTALQTADNALWTVTLAGTISGGVANSVQATADEAGSAGNLDNGAILSLVTPIAGVDTDATVSGKVSDGSDVEDPEAYRERIIDGVRTPPAGGGPGDYEAWALEVAGVTRAWEKGTRMGVGTVSVAFVRDNDGGSIIPDVGEIATVYNHIASQMPLDVRTLYVQAPVAKPVNITFTELEPNTPAVRAAITAELQDFFRRTDLEVGEALSRISEAISAAEGEQSHAITTSSLTADSGTWELLTLGTITFPPS